MAQDCPSFGLRAVAAGRRRQSNHVMAAPITSALPSMRVAINYKRLPWNPVPPDSPAAVRPDAHLCRASPPRRSDGETDSGRLRRGRRRPTPRSGSPLTRTTPDLAGPASYDHRVEGCVPAATQERFSRTTSHQRIQIAEPVQVLPSQPARSQEAAELRLLLRLTQARPDPLWEPPAWGAPVGSQGVDGDLGLVASRTRRVGPTAGVDLQVSRCSAAASGGLGSRSPGAECRQHQYARKQEPRIP